MEEKFLEKVEVGTLAIDLGNSTTVVAFQNEKDLSPQLLPLSTICRSDGEVPSLIACQKNDLPKYLVGQEVSELDFIQKQGVFISSDFKRWIGSTHSFQSTLSPEKSGEILLHKIWERIPINIKVKRLVLTAPVETYRSYRAWLRSACDALPVDEIALVDEPTAAAMGAGIPGGSKLLVVDIGGSTIDFSLVALEGGEGRPEAMAQLIRFGGNDLEGKSNQVLRSAKVLGKAGQRIGGRDFDRWIVNSLYPQSEITESLLNAAERLKCRLSNKDLKEDELLTEETNNLNEVEISLCKSKLENILREKGLLKVLNNLLNQTLNSGIVNGCKIENIRAFVIVGGGARIPLIRNWLKEKIQPIPLLTPPPIEAVAKGALKLTPGVTVRDLLQRGVSMRCWEKKSNKHVWHPIFIAGQPWPSTKPFEIILSASTTNQKEVELFFGECSMEGCHEIIYKNGIPTIKEANIETQITPWEDLPHTVNLTQIAQPGEDCLKLNFSIDKQCRLIMSGLDLRNGSLVEERNLGSIR